MAERRDELREEAVTELESKLDWYIDRLETLYQRPGRKPGERDHLKQKIEKFYQEIRREKQQHWRDRQELEKEIREVLRELDELEEPLLDFL